MWTEKHCAVPAAGRSGRLPAGVAAHGHARLFLIPTLTPPEGAPLSCPGADGKGASGEVSASREWPPGSRSAHATPLPPPAPVRASRTRPAPRRLHVTQRSHFHLIVQALSTGVCFCIAFLAMATGGLDGRCHRYSAHVELHARITDSWLRHQPSLLWTTELLLRCLRANSDLCLKLA